MKSNWAAITQEIRQSGQEAVACLADEVSRFRAAHIYPRENSQITTGVLVENFIKTTPKRYQDPVLWAWLEFFALLRDAKSKTAHYLLS